MQNEPLPTLEPSLWSGGYHPGHSQQSLAADYSYQLVDGYDVNNNHHGGEPSLSFPIAQYISLL